MTIQAPTEETLTQVPVPVRLSWLTEPDEALRFVSSSGDVLAHEVDQDLAWVSLPSLPGGSVLEVFAYYDNPSANPAPDPGALWADPFALVVHGDDFEDASGNHQHDETKGPGHAPAVFGDGLLFDGVDDGVIFGPEGASADLREDGLTLTAWIRVSPKQDADYPRIIDHTEAAASRTGWTLALNPNNAGAFRLRVDLGLDVAESRQTFDVPLPQEWFFLAVTVTPDDMAQARFNDLVTEVAPAAGEGVALTDAQNLLSLGRSSHTDERWFAGEIDELRVVRGVRSAAWLETEFQLATGELVLAGEPELAPTASP